METEELDLDIHHYSLQDLFHLFHLSSSNLGEDSMKQAKKMVLKMHPDKSHLDPKYFLFFSHAYKRLYAVYEFQNKSLTKKFPSQDFSYEEEQKRTLDHLFEKNTKLKDPKGFNDWFNQEFEKHKLSNQNDLDKGYGDWLKSEQDMYHSHIQSQADMHEEFEKQKKKIQSITMYQGISDSFSSTLGGALLGENNHYSSGLFDQGLSYQDVKQAHLETIIPITQEDYQNRPKFTSAQEYKRYRDTQDITPLKETDALQKIRSEEEDREQQSAKVAYYYAQQLEESQKQHNLFWSNLQRIKNG